MHLHVKLKCEAVERSFFVSISRVDLTFTWLARALFHRYTIFVPEVDKAAPPHVSPAKPANAPSCSLPGMFSPPARGKILDYVKEGDRVICHIERHAQSKDVRIKFFLNSSGKPLGHDYITLSAKKQQALHAAFKSNRFHKFQHENQKKLAQYISKQTKNPATSSPERTGKRGRGRRCSEEAPPGKALQPRPPSQEACRDSKVTHRFRRRAKEKAALKASNQPLYDYDPDDLDGSDWEDACGCDEATGWMQGTPRRRNQSPVPLSSRQASLNVRRLSFRRTPNSLTESRKTEIRQTVLDSFKIRAANITEGSEPFSTDLIQRGNDLIRDDDMSRYLIKPNGPISKDVLWRQRVLGSRGLKQGSRD